jgi:light-regulated signal transduction histidine kinase (bacteriophytochrome)
LGRRHDDARFPVELSISVVSLDERSICTLIVRDVTEREAAASQMRTQMLKLQEVKENLEAKAAELAKINRELDDFTYVASHDLKEPLRGISSYCQILLEDYGGKLDDDGQRRLEALVGLCQRLGRLIDDLLTYSQIARSEPDATTLDLNQIVADVIETLGPAIDERNAVVRVRGSLPTVEADRVLTGEVFRNLIANALKFNDHVEPSVEIGCDDGTTLTVRDNGIGIPECHQQAVFTMFRRLHSRRKYDGTGAGLTFVRKIIEAHGGRVWLVSQPGCGSTFSFTLGSDPAHARQETTGCAVG